MHPTHLTLTADEVRTLATQPERLIGLGVYFQGFYGSASESGAITSAEAIGADVSFVVHLEDGRVIRDNRLSRAFGGLRATFLINGKMHGRPYLDELVAIATTREVLATAAKTAEVATYAARMQAAADQFVGVRFGVFAVTKGKLKARVHYSLDNRADGRPCVRIYDRDYGDDLRAIIPTGYENRTDSMVDYFERGHVVLFEGHPLYQAARDRANANAARRK
ncbi:hypothetical protein [Pseudacidovorax sp. NFM-22]|uniref:hypothetical protein n=1 Tax=Pseudacidovorax sp. NFM-22 TaxID=2744469 RepID=UPI001F3F301D|nr:hypothetical protein [Pseudacidovorax sp. NFM-22]